VSEVVQMDQFMYILMNIGLGGAVLYVFYRYLDKIDSLTQAINDLRSTQEKLMALLDLYLRGNKDK